MNLLELRVFWGRVLLRVDHVRFPWRFAIGQGRGVDVFVASEDLPSESYPLVRTDDRRCVIAVAPGMRGELERGGEVQPLTGTDYTLEEADRAVVVWGGLTFALRFVPPESAAPRFAWRDVDHDIVRPLSVSLFGHLAAVVSLLVMPYATDSLREDFHSIDRIAELLPAQRPERHEPIRVTRTETRPPTRTDGAASEARVTSMHAGGPARLDSIKQRIHDMLSSTSLAGRGHLGEALVKLVGSRGPTGASGYVGVGMRNAPGDFGSPLSSLDIGHPDGGRLHLVASERSLGEHRDHSLITPTTPSVYDALPREVIRAVVDRNRAQIRYCYERELQKQQDLEGRVVMRWIVAATGAVVRVDVVESTLASREVVNCLTSQIARWRFPEPAGGGVVTVSYPFVFRAN